MEHEKFELFMTNLELQNSDRLKEKVAKHSEEYRNLLLEDIKIFKKKQRLYEALGEQ